MLKDITQKERKYWVSKILSAIRLVTYAETLPVPAPLSNLGETGTGHHDLIQILLKMWQQRKDNIQELSLIHIYVTF